MWKNALIIKPYSNWASIHLFSILIRPAEESSNNPNKGNP